MLGVPCVLSCRAVCLEKCSRKCNSAPNPQPSRASASPWQGSTTSPASTSLASECKTHWVHIWIFSNLSSPNYSQLLKESEIKRSTNCSSDWQKNVSALLPPCLYTHNIHHCRILNVMGTSLRTAQVCSNFWEVNQSWFVLVNHNGWWIMVTVCRNRQTSPRPQNLKHPLVATSFGIQDLVTDIMGKDP